MTKMAKITMVTEHLPQGGIQWRVLLNGREFGIVDRLDVTSGITAVNPLSDTPQAYGVSDFDVRTTCDEYAWLAWENLLAELPEAEE